ncbi:type I polyketide synthase [Saccharothrix xinjiangensis]|uniref:Type I polyketide synthase n=1 Tax=Saccharothrix xinjiangensis TaxID=204798 RepID=A0ABV9YC42_9PSEU
MSTSTEPAGTESQGTAPAATGSPGAAPPGTGSQGTESIDADPGEPIAVVGVGCRFPGGADSPEAFWDLLASGRDGIGPVPRDRWLEYRDQGPEHAAAVRRADRAGGFLTGVDGFDAAFFGLSPREAELMDPQQRLLLEVSWEALEDAGIPPTSLAGGTTGVFVGIGSDDYGRRLLEDLPGIEAWTGIGAAMCAAANRVSHALDLRGPSLAVDTACSASLVATHLAVRALRAGECPVALVGGVNLMLAPGLPLTLAAAGATAPDGRSKPFDAAADGYGRGEGAGVLVLKRLSDARRDGDRVLALVLGGAVRQDGRTNGIMAPSGTAQRDLLVEACARAGVDPASVDYVEAHGTGTPLGDRLEAGALAEVYGRDRPAGRPCLIGSVKANIGHLEAGAGVASLIKAALVLAHREIPPSLNHTTPTPAVDWADSGLRVVTGRTPWPAREHPRRIGVSGFGYGGTIGHLLLEQAPEPATEPAAEPAVAQPAGPRLFPLSAASPEALAEQAGRLADHLSTPGAPTADLAAVGRTLAARRAHLPHRGTVVAEDRAELVDRLRSLARGDRGREIATGLAAPRRVVWVFSGHGSQWAGMGRALLAGEPAFAEVLAELEPVFAAEIGFSPRQALFDGDFATVDRVQGLIFAVQVGLAAVWRSYGAEPDAVIGHSVGELAAAVVAGELSPVDGARLSCRRSVLLRRVAGAGAMAMAGLPFDEVAVRLAGRADVVPAIAAAPSSTVVSGTPEAVDALVAAWRAEEVVVRRVASDVAFHSPQMDPLATELAAAVADLEPRAGRIPRYSTAAEDPRAGGVPDGAYWAANLRAPVRLMSAVRAALDDGYDAFVEISAHPVVAHSIDEVLAEAGADTAFVGWTLRRDQPTPHAALGAAHCRGVRLDWDRLHPQGGHAALPGVAWQHRSHWHGTGAGRGAGLGHDVDAHALLGPEVPVAGRSLRLWRTRLDDTRRPYPGSHTVNGVEIVPAAVLLTTLLGAAGGADLARVALRLPLGTAEERELQVVRDGDEVRLASRAGEGPWSTHTTAEVVARTTADGDFPDPADLAPADPAEVTGYLAAVGVPTMAFGWEVEELRRGDGAAWARVRPVHPEHAPPTWAPLFDAALSLAPSVFPGEPTLRVVAGFGSVRVDGPPPTTAELLVTTGEDGTAEVLVTDGTSRARLGAVAFGSLSGWAPRDFAHRIAWRDVVPADDGSARDVVLVGPADARATALRDALRAAGARCRIAADPADPGTATDVLVLPAAEPGTTVPDAAASAVWLATRTAQRLAEQDGPARLWLLTAGAREAADGPAAAQSALWGLGRVIAVEHEELWGGTVDLPAREPEREAGALLALLRSGGGEDVVAVRGGACSAARVAPVDREPTGAPLTCAPDATYLVTGGLGALGAEVARWLAGRGARRIVLAGRRGLPARSTWDGPLEAGERLAVDRVRELEALGVTVRVVAVDIADAVAAAFDPDALGLPPVRGVVHAAGVLDNRMVRSVDEASVRAVLRPKVDGAWVLHELFPEGTLDFLVLFSSCGHLLGMPGQATYGAANAFLDGLAALRADTTSLGWTSWRGRGMAVDDAVDRELAARGVGDIPPAVAFEVWDLLSRTGPGHYPVLAAAGTGSVAVPVLAELTAPKPEAEPDESFGGLSEDELRERLLVEVGSQIAGEMRMAASALDPRRSLVEQGLDSVMTIVVRRRLEQRFGHKLPSTLLWHRPSVTAIADHLVEALSPAS